MQILLDLTTTGSLAQRRLDAYLAAKSVVPAEKIVVVAIAARIERPGGTRLVEVEGNPAEVWTELEREIMASAELSDAGLTVVSYQNSVKEFIARNNSLAQRVTFVDFRSVVHTRSSVTEWPNSQYPINDALSILQRVINRSGGTLRKTAIRPALIVEDPRFRRRDGDPDPLANRNIVSLLLQEAVNRNLVVLSGDESNPFVSSVPADTAIEQLPSEGFLRESDRYLDLLRAAGLGPFQQVRWAIYDAIDTAITSGDEHSIQTLLDSAVAKVRSDVEAARAAERDYLVAVGRKNLPWSQVRGFIGVLMTRVPVLLDPDKRPVRADWLGMRIPISGVLPKWRLMLDSVLVIHLIEQHCAISQYEEAELSGALYDTRHDLERVRDLIVYLLESGNCEMSEDHTELKLRRDGVIRG